MIRGLVRVVHVALALLMLSTLAPPTALAQPAPGRAPAPARAGAGVEVELVVVHASNAHQSVDPSLKPVERHLRFLNYTGFKSLDRHNRSLRVGEQTTVSVVGGREMKVRLIDKNPTAAKLRVQLFRGASKLLDTTVSIHRNRSFIVGGPQHDGGVLVFPLTASY